VLCPSELLLCIEWVLGVAGIKVAENSCNWLPKASLVDNGTTYNTMSGGEEDTGGDKTVSFAPEEEKSAKVLQQKLSMLQEQHELQCVSNSLSFPKPVARLVFWTRPKQRQRWGDVDSHCHINWGDLFFDLFYVACEWTHFVACLLVLSLLPTNIICILLHACSFLASY